MLRLAAAIPVRPISDSGSCRLSAGDGADDQERLAAAGDVVRQPRVGGFERPVRAACEKSHEWPPLAGDMIAHRSREHRIARLERVENVAWRDVAVDVKRHFVFHARQRAQMLRQLDADVMRHDSVWTSTESTGGRSCTMLCQVSPASDDAYTCPPVVPK